MRRDTSVLQRGAARGARLFVPVGYDLLDHRGSLPGASSRSEGFRSGAFDAAADGPGESSGYGRGQVVDGEGDALSGRFLWMLAGGACAALPVAPGAVSGVVRDAAGGPVPHAQVWIPGTGLRAYADSFGHYVLDSVPAGRMQLRATLVGRQAEQRRSVEITAARWTRVDFVLQLPGCDRECKPLAVPASSGQDSVATGKR